MGMDYGGIGAQKSYSKRPQTPCVSGYDWMSRDNKGAFFQTSLLTVPRITKLSASFKRRASRRQHLNVKADFSRRETNQPAIPIWSIGRLYIDFYFPYKIKQM